MAWYESFFDEDYLCEYAALLTPERTENEVEAVIGLVGPPPLRILDLCCGHGRHAIELAARGYEVCGQDLSAVFLAKAEADAQARGAQMELRRGDMRRIEHEPPFDAVLNLFTAFGYFDDDAQEMRVLREVHRVLRPGGVFVLDVVNRDAIMRKFLPKSWDRLEDGSWLLCERVFDPVRGACTDHRTRVMPDGSTRERETVCRLFTPTELRRMLREAGLEPTVVQGGLGGGEITMDSSRTTLVARKP